jgi:hypothetical protein
MISVAKVGSAGTTRQIEITNTGNMPGGMFIAVITGGAIGSFQILGRAAPASSWCPPPPALQVRYSRSRRGSKSDWALR